MRIKAYWKTRSEPCLKASGVCLEVICGISLKQEGDSLRIDMMRRRGIVESRLVLTLLLLVVLFFSIVFFVVLSAVFSAVLSIYS